MIYILIIAATILSSIGIVLRIAHQLQTIDDERSP